MRQAIENASGPSATAHAACPSVPDDAGARKLSIAPAPQLRKDLGQNQSFAAARMAAIAAGGVVQSSGHIQNFDNQARRMDHYFDLVSIGIMT